MANPNNNRNQGGRPSPSGVPNERKGIPGQPGSNDDRGRNVQSGYEYKGGRQGSGGVPNPDDPDDVESAGSFRGTTERNRGLDKDDGDKDVNSMPSTERHVPGGPDEDTQNPG
jgi:hypothetical protein